MTIALDLNRYQSGNVIPFPARDDSLLLHGLALRDQGISICAAANELAVPRTTLRDRLAAFDKIALPTPVKRVFVTQEGQSFLKRVCLALHVCFRAGSDCGLRLLGTFLEMTGLDAVIGASLGSQWSFGRKVEEYIVEFGGEEILRMVPGTDGKEISIAADENFHEGPCLVALEPQSDFLLCETVAPGRETKDWREALAPILALLGVKVIQVTSDSGKSIIALCESVLGAHHSPDLFHILYDFKRTFAPTTRSAQRLLEREIRDSEKEVDALTRMMKLWARLSPSERGRGPAPQFERNIMEEESKQTALFSRLALLERQQRELDAALRALSDGYHPVSLETGRRTGACTCELLLKQVVNRACILIAEFSLDEDAERTVEKLERMGEKMLGTLARVATLWHTRAVALGRDSKEVFVLESLLAPAAYLERIGDQVGTLARHGLTTKSRELREQAMTTIGEERVNLLLGAAGIMAQEFQRSSSAVEGRNGTLSLRHHAFHELPTQKRAVLTTLHNHVIRRPDGTTAAERLSGVPSRDLITYLCDRIDSFPRAGGEHKLRKVS